MKGITGRTSLQNEKYKMPLCFISPSEEEKQVKGKK